MQIPLPKSFGAGLIRTMRKARRARPLRRKLRTGDPVQDLCDAAVELGYSGNPDDLTAMARYCWEEEPTDGMAELLEELAEAGLIASPFY